MFYSKNKEDLSKELFKRPTSEYRGTPFWAWNTRLEKDELLEQIEQLKKMGMGGFHIHSRVGLDIEYLSEKFMDMVEACNNKAKQEEMLCWLYDEDRWPSGAAGGYVTKDEKYRARFLVFSPNDYDQGDDKSLDEFDSSGKAQRSGKRELLAKYEVVLKDGHLDYYKKLEEGEQASREGKIWRAYLEVSGDNPWFNNQAYVNTLDKEAIDKFIDITHEKYYKEFGEDFGQSIPAIFTDEPQFTRKSNLGYAAEEKDVILPFTDDLEETYKSTYGESLLEHLPELIWELPENNVSQVRYRYHDHICERFTEAFADNVGSWCEDHGIMLTGHMMEEPTLESQTAALGEAMRSYRSFQLPGIDMLCDRREYSTAKQAQSAAHQYGYPGTLSELYGVTNWDFDFRGHKLQGDWQAALGVTVRVHHLTWVSMEGEAKRDYPASIGYQSPWYQEYSLIEDHFSRLNTALTRGKPDVKVGVIHPVESYWLHWGPREQTAIIREELETNFENITDWLLFGLVDFDYISESLFPSQAEVKEADKLTVGEMDYDVIVVPGCETLRSTTLDRLEAFEKGGGKVIFVGEPAGLVDVQASDRAKKLADKCETVPFSRSRVLSALDSYRDIDIRKEDGARANNLFYQMRVDGDKKWLFICHVNKMENPDIPSMEKINLRIKGNWAPEIYDTLAGEIKECSFFHKGDETIISHQFSQHDSLLLRLEPVSSEDITFDQHVKSEDTGSGESGSENKVKSSSVDREINSKKLSREKIDLQETVPVTLSEPNVLLLDMAEYAFDDGDWRPKEEILRIDNKFREKLGYPLRMNAMAQPWLNEEKEGFEHKLSLRFKINSEIKVDSPVLALENAEVTEIEVNGEKVESGVEGWYVDKCIKKVALPSLPAGDSEIILRIPFNSKTNVEWCYLLGDFGVEVKGSRSKIIESVRKLSFGDWTKQGLPFYAGNVTYHCPVSCDKGDLILEAPQFRNPLLTVSLDGERVGEIAFAPYKLNIEIPDKGEHVVDITAFGNRVNTFGTVHNSNHTHSWFGPDAWRTTGNSWAYEYQLKPTGVLIRPVFYQ